MADTKISALTAVPSSSAADIFAVVQGGATKKETLAQLQAVTSATHLAVSGSCTAIQFSGTNITANYIVIPAISGTNITVTYALPTNVSATALNTASLSAVTCSLTYLTTLSITAGTVLGTVVATGGASGTYSSGDLVITNGIVTTIP